MNDWKGHKRRSSDRGQGLFWKKKSRNLHTNCTFPQMPTQCRLSIGFTGRNCVEKRAPN
jgi:hypothetical protein